ncbi:MAG: NosD domain-containing protein [Halobacteriota archaeon]
MEEEAMDKIVKIFVIGLMLMLGLFFNGSVCGEIEGDSISLNANYTGITFEEATETPAEEYWAVIVGATTVYAYHDARDMYNVLTRASDNWEASHIQILVNESATKANIRDAIQWMANNAGTEDTCLFFFSGHGENDTIDYNGDEADGIDESLITFDAEIIDDELEEWIGEVKAKKVVAILEACHSGGVLTPYQISEAIETSNELDGFGFAMDLEKANCMVLASSRMNEIGWIAFELKNSVFTYYVVQGLWGAADLDGDSRISARELSDYSFPRTVEYSEFFYPNPQHPLLWPEDDTASNLTLIKLKTYVPKKISVPAEYRTIPEAVEAAMPGDTIEVYPGTFLSTYYENLIINKPLIINARARHSIIQADRTLPCIFITVDNTSISGLTFQNGFFGLYLFGSNNNKITNNEALNNLAQGIVLLSSCENIIANNTADNNRENGIYLEESANNRITDNYVSNNDYNGISLNSSTSNEIRNNIANSNYYEGIALLSSNENIIADNTAENNRDNGIYLNESANNRITDNYVSNNDYNGISLNFSTSNEIRNNIANSNYYEGIGLWTSNENIIANNTADNNRESGIYLNASNSNIVTDNNASNNSLSGIYVVDSSNNTLRNNLMMGNLWNFGTDGDSYSDFNNDIDTSNLVDGKPIYYLVGASGNVIDSSSNAGTVYCISCDNITVKDLNLINNFVGIGFFNTSNSRIQNNYLINEWGGVSLYESNSNAITGNTISDNVMGISILEYSDGNTITDNEVTGNELGISFLNYSTRNAVTGNNIGNSIGGIVLQNTTSNKIYLNNFINNTENVYSENSTNIWNSPEKIIYTYKGSNYTNYLGNYWHNFISTDANNDGIWDNPYIIDLDLDKDYQPLVMPWENYVKPAEEEKIFDTGSSANPYPSIMGRHEGKIIPSYDIRISRVYTYPCAGTGGHTESIKIYENGELIASGTWNGYAGDWHNITITPSVTLYKNNEYTYVIETGSYPQIHHTESLEVANGMGTITCDIFIDANGRIYYDWIPAIKLFL